MEAVRRLTARMRVVVPILVLSNGVVKPSSCERFSSAEQPPPSSSSSSSSLGSEGKGLGWFAGLAGAGNNRRSNLLPNIVKAGDPVLHQRACEVEPSEMKSERVQKLIDDMISVMRNSPGGVGLAAPQIGIPFRIRLTQKKNCAHIIVLEYKGGVSNARDSRPFDLLVILNPKLKKKSNRTALFFEGCLSVDGFAAVVERCLDVEVEGFDRYGEPIKISASGWQARILQHECDHLDGTLYVDKMVPRTFRTEKNINLPLAHGCPKRAKLGPRA